MSVRILLACLLVFVGAFLGAWASDEDDAMSLPAIILYLVAIVAIMAVGAIF